MISKQANMFNFYIIFTFYDTLLIIFYVFFLWIFYYINENFNSPHVDIKLMET